MRLNDAVAENRLLTRWADLLPRPPGQVGGVHETDAELVPLGDGRLLALTVDAVDEEVRCGLYRDARAVGRLAAAAALSDLAAVGAEPIGLLLSVGLPAGERERTQERLACGVREVCEAAGTFVLGGDTNDAVALSVAVVAAGLVPAATALTRVGAAPGDVVGLTGLVGAGASFAAARLLGRPADAAEDRWLPRPRLREGRSLRGLASACMDTSDGLVATLDQISRLNRVAIRVTRPPDQLLEPGAAAVCGGLGLPAFAFLASPLGEYELAFTVPARRWNELSAASARAGWTPVEIGRVEPGMGVFLGRHAVDGARVRNLLGDVGGDARVCARAIAEMAR